MTYDVATLGKFAYHKLCYVLYAESRASHPFWIVDDSLLPASSSEAAECLHQAAWDPDLWKPIMIHQRSSIVDMYLTLPAQGQARPLQACYERQILLMAIRCLMMTYDAPLCACH